MELEDSCQKVTFQCHSYISVICVTKFIEKLWGLKCYPRKMSASFETDNMKPKYNSSNHTSFNANHTSTEILNCYSYNLRTSSDECFAIFHNLALPIMPRYCENKLSCWEVGTVSIKRRSAISDDAINRWYLASMSSGDVVLL